MAPDGPLLVQRLKSLLRRFVPPVAAEILADFGEALLRRSKAPRQTRVPLRWKRWRGLPLRRLEPAPRTRLRRPTRRPRAPRGSPNRRSHPRPSTKMRWRVAVRWLNRSPSPFSAGPRGSSTSMLPTASGHRHKSERHRMGRQEHRPAPVARPPELWRSEQHRLVGDLWLGALFERPLGGAQCR